MVTKDRERAGRPAEAGSISAAGPVVLGTLSSRVEPEAERIAIESALDANVRLLVVNVMPLPLCPRALLLGGPQAVNLPHEEDYEAVRATAERAASRGIRVEHLRVTSPHPIRALVELVNERRAGLLVLGPKRDRVSRRHFKRAARAVRRGTACLVWIAGA
jgi:hypothetical protein